MSLSSQKLRELGYEIGPDNVARKIGSLPQAAKEKPEKASIRLPRAQKMSKPEQEYMAILRKEFPDESYTVRFEPFALRLKSGARYSPDLVVFWKDRILCACEVKGGFRLQSAARSYLAFKTAISEYPDWPWRFAEKREGQWIITEPKA